MAHHHHVPEQGLGVISIIITSLVSIWVSIEMEVKHGFITFFFGIVTCIAVYFLNRFLKKRFP